jgi:hypothetical protein
LENHLVMMGAGAFEDDAKALPRCEAPKGHDAMDKLSAKFGDFVPRLRACFRPQKPGALNSNPIAAPNFHLAIIKAKP